MWIKKLARIKLALSRQNIINSVKHIIPWISQCLAKLKKCVQKTRWYQLLTPPGLNRTFVEVALYIHEFKECSCASSLVGMAEEITYKISKLYAETVCLYLWRDVNIQIKVLQQPARINESYERNYSKIAKRSERPFLVIWKVIVHKNPSFQVRPVCAETKA